MIFLALKLLALVALLDVALVFAFRALAARNYYR